MTTLLAPRPASRTSSRTCAHCAAASRIGLVNRDGSQVVRPLRITNLDVVEAIRDERATGSDVLVFIASDGCRLDENPT